MIAIARTHIAGPPVDPSDTRSNLLNGEFLFVRTGPITCAVPDRASPANLGGTKNARH
ncbi:hypothetical protein [Streptomyces sp. NPDC006856]|uniref:hypothetical protein n=1 Tax=Streptomyces sp. NPDC006856 TaxID=3364766 RepID=UPI00367B1109